LGSHLPLGAVDRRADLGEVVVHFELGGSGDVAPQIVGIDLERRVVAPLVGVPNLRCELRQLLEAHCLVGSVIHSSAEMSIRYASTRLPTSSTIWDLACGGKCRST
jgi:hypothetical protein